MGKIKGSKPLFCDLIVSHRCFFKCQMCVDWKTPLTATALNFDDAKKFIDQLADFIDYKIDINIMGGEPFMLDWLLPLCDYIHHKGFKAIVSTNAYLIDEEMAKKIMNSNIGVLAISLDGIKAETHDSIRGKEGAYSRVIDAIGYLKKYCNSSLHICILSLILKENLEELPKLVKWTKETGVVNSISFLALVESGLVNPKEGWFKRSEYSRLWPQDSHKVEESIDSVIALKKQGYNIDNPFSQLEAFKKYYKDPEKFVKETEYCIHDYILDLDPTGDIFLSGHFLGKIKGNNSLKSLWVSEEADRIRKYIDLHGCDNSRACLINFACVFTQDGDDQPDYFGKRAIYYQAAEKYDLALTYFKKALEVNPNNANLHVGAADMYLKLKDHNAALNEYNKALKLKPDCKIDRNNYIEATKGRLKINKYLISLSGIFIVLLMLELCLRIGGWAYLRQRHPEAYKETKAFGENKFTILCLGDSFTEGAGTDRNNGYPKQLERILRKNITRVEINVINGGRGANTSSLLLKYLQRDIARYNPDIVIVMVGYNNIWNFQDSSYFIINNKGKYFLKNLDNLLYNLRTYKMLKIAYVNAKAFFNADPGKIYKEHDEFSKFEEVVDSMNIDERSKALTKSAVSSRAEGNFDLALNQLEDALAIDGNNYMAHICIGNMWSIKKESGLARAARLRAIHKINIWNKFLVTSLIEQIDTELRQGRANKQEALDELETIKKAAEISHEANVEDNAVAIIDAEINSIEDKSVIQEIIAYDLSQVIRAVKDNGSKIVLETYPSSNFLNIFREISEKFNVPLVDNYMVFKKDGFSQDLFVSDGHCNSKGYGIIAENTYKTLVEHKLLPE